MLSYFCAALLLLHVTTSRHLQTEPRSEMSTLKSNNNNIEDFTTPSTVIVNSVELYQQVADENQSKDITKFKDYAKYITGPTPTFPVEHRIVKVGPTNLLNCTTREQLNEYTSPEFEGELRRRIEKLTQRYSRVRSHKPLVKHQLRNKLSFLRRVLGNVGQDPTDLNFEGGNMDTMRPIPLRFINALNNVAGETSTVLGYLLAFGYLPKVMHLPRRALKELKSGSSDDLTASPCQLEEAIGEFQKFNGLPVTKRLDAATVKKLKKARCGIPDVPAGRKGKEARRRKHSRKHSRTKRYVLRKRGWRTGPNRELTYYVKNCTSTLPYHTCKEEIKLGIKRWTEVANIYMREVGEAESETADFTLFFVSGEHPKKNISSPKNDEPFDGPGGVIGHAYFPRGGHIHFDDAETYTAYSNIGINLRFIAMHEMGHALGLEHSGVANAAMAPVYNPREGMKGWEGSDTLQWDDIAGIRKKYGEEPGSIIALTD